jgi:hypothetical protein
METPLTYTDPRHRVPLLEEAPLLDMIHAITTPIGTIHQTFDPASTTAAIVGIVVLKKQICVEG